MQTSTLERPTTPQQPSRYAFNPVGMIPEFNALGNHPPDLLEHFDTKVRTRFGALGISHDYRGIRDYLPEVIRQMQRASGGAFAGYHRTEYPQYYLSLAFVRALVNDRKCNFENYGNYRMARELAREGHNILVVQNHTSVLDTFIFYTALATQTGFSEPPVSFMMSQNFLYVRLTAIMVSGGNLFRTFQPKHITRFREKDAAHQRAATTMMRQNVQTLRELRSHCARGGKMICLYPEMNRGTIMGEPEPRYLTMLKAMQPENGRSVYVLPINTTGHHPIIPNAPGTNELDTVADRLQIGWGTARCGAPVPLETIERTLEHLGRQDVTHGILGRTPEKEDDLRYLSLGLAFCSMIAALASDKADRGIYESATARALARRLN